MSSFIAYVTWFKETYPLLFELGKVIGALGGAYLAVRQFQKDRRERLDVELRTQHFKLRETGTDQARLKAETAALRKQVADLDDEAERLVERTVAAALARAERERSEGNHEVSARILSDWHRDEGPGVAEATQHLASWYEARLQGQADHYDLKLDADSLRALAELAAPDSTRTAEARRV